MSRFLRIGMILAFASLTIALTPSPSVEQLPINIGASEIESIGQDTLYIHNVTSPVVSGSYWLTFKWDPERLVFDPVDVGADNITPPYRNLVGSYRMKAFTVIYSNGIVLNERNTVMSGVMIVGNSTLSQSFTLNGQPIALSGSYLITVSV